MQFKRDYEGTNFVTGLRAIAIFLVFLIHSGGGGLRKISEAFNLFVDFGKYGVAMFFVISGFTIFHQLYSGNYSYIRFLKIRISRISIPYFPLIFLIFAYISLGGEQFNPWAIKYNSGVISLFNLFTHLTYTASFSTKYATTIIGVEWSLHIEVFYYVILGYLITIGFLKNKYKRLVFALIGSILIASLFLYLGYVNLLDPLLVQWMPFQYGWMFMLGGVGFYWRKLVNTKLPKRIQINLSNLSIMLSITSLFLLLNCKAINGVGPLNEAFFACLTFILIVFVKDSSSLSAILTNRISIYLGSISFSFYLLHFIVIQSHIASKFLNNETLIFVINFIVTVVISHFWFQIFEHGLYKKVKGRINRQGYDGKNV